MKKPKRQLVPRDYDLNTKTKSEFFGKFRSAIRKIWMFSAIRREALKRAKVAPNRYKCSDCEGLFKSNEVEVNHKIPAGSLKEFNDFNGFVSRMFQEDLDLLEVVCKSCHKIFTAKQREDNNK